MSLPLVAAYLLAAIFAAAAVAKVGRPTATARDLAELGMVWPAVLARALPATELAVAVALVVIPVWGAVAGFALLAAFTTVLARVVRSGRATNCACFGQLTNRPVSWRTLARNGVLLVLAAIAVSG